MNWRELVLKNGDKHLRVRPFPLIDKRGQLVPLRDEQNRWMVMPAQDRKIQIQSVWFPHMKTLGGDNILGFHEPNFLRLKCQLIFRGQALDIEPLPMRYWG